MSVHTRVNDPEVYTSDTLFDKAVSLVERSQAAALIEQWRSESIAPVKRSNALPYNIFAVLTALACVMLRRSEPAVRTIYRTMLDLTPAQMERVGINPAAIAPIQADAARSLPSFRDWLKRMLDCLDPAPDQPARRISRAEHAAIERRRTPEQAARYELAAERLSIIINRLVAGSIDPRYARIGAGDIVVDETIIDTSSAEHVFAGSSEDGHSRGSVYCGDLYRRDQANRVDTDDTGKQTPSGQLKKRGWAVGVTAVSAIGEPATMHNRPTLFTGIAIHPPTPGSLTGLTEAVHHHKANGLDARPKNGRARWPMLFSDMGYLRSGLLQWQITHRYAAVHTYPSSWNTDYSALDATTGELLGPVQLSGNWYCPSAAALSLGKKYVVRLRELLATDDWQARDSRLRELLLRLMGVDRKPVMRRARAGRPSEDDSDERVVKVVLTCPAALGNIRCMRWSNPHTEGRIDLPLIDPPDSMPVYRCCTQPTVTVTLTPAQMRMQQLSHYAPGSFEHAISLEAARALTEQRFSQVKSRAVAGLQDLRFGVRREPLLKIIIAMAFAIVNISEIERYESGGSKKPESVQRNWARLDRDLGKPAMRMPNRT